MDRTGLFAVIVQFDTTPENQSQALEEISAYIDDFLSRQPGFVQSWMHRSLDGNSLAHYALWQNESQFKAVGEKARQHPAFPGLMQYQPRGQQLEVCRAFGNE